MKFDYSFEKLNLSFIQERIDELKEKLSEIWFSVELLSDIVEDKEFAKAVDPPCNKELVLGGFIGGLWNQWNEDEPINLLTRPAASYYESAAKTSVPDIEIGSVVFRDNKGNTLCTACGSKYLTKEMEYKKN